MVNIDTGNIYITTGSISGNTITGGTTVKIWTTKIDYNYNNALSEIPIPISKGGREELKDNSQEPFSRVVDLKRIKEAISVQGFLEDETSESAVTKRNNLLTLGKVEGSLKLVWGQSPYQTLWKSQDNAKDGTGIFISKMVFTETAGIVGESVSGDSQPERNIAVQIQVVRGKDI